MGAARYHLGVALDYGFHAKPRALGARASIRDSPWPPQRRWKALSLTAERVGDVLLAVAASQQVHPDGRPCRRQGLLAPGRHLRFVGLDACKTRFH